MHMIKKVQKVDTEYSAQQYQHAGVMQIKI